MAKVIINIPDIAIGRSAVIDVEGRRILFCRSATALHALDEICPHQNKSLDGGRVRGNSLICPHHGARFSLEDGKSLSPLTNNGLKLFPCDEKDGRAEIILDEREGGF